MREAKVRSCPTDLAHRPRAGRTAPSLSAALRAQRGRSQL